MGSDIDGIMKWMRQQDAGEFADEVQSRIAALEQTVSHLREVAAEQHAWEEMAERCGLPLKPEAAERCVLELRDAVRVLAAECVASQVLLRWPVSTKTYDMPTERAAWVTAQDATEANPIAAAAVREAGR